MPSIMFHHASGATTIPPNSNVRPMIRMMPPTFDFASNGIQHEERDDQ